MNNKKTANYKQKDLLQQVPLNVMAEIDLKNNLSNVSEEVRQAVKEGALR